MADVTLMQSLSKEKNEHNSNPLTKKLNKILENRLENDKDTLEALKALSTFFDENSLRTRRSLRSDIEKRSVHINENFLSSLKQVKECVDGIFQDVVKMNDCCSNMADRLRNVKTQTNDLINQTTKLQSESWRLQLHEDVIKAFLEMYQLNSDELKALRGTNDGTLHPAFFSALNRAKRMHDDCKFLLRTNQQTAGLEIMESMALHQETAFKHLYKWTQNECRTQSADSPDIPSLLCEAMAALQDRPVLYQCALGEFATARRGTVVRTFLHALTRGGPGGTPRAMELLSHEPLRYVGDMLAWVHQAAASEKEHLELLLKLCSPNSEIDSYVIGIEEPLISTLGHIMEGVCRPLKVRIEQVVVSETGTVALYRLANLLKFYHGTMRQVLVSEQSALLVTLEDLYSLGRQMFLNSLNCHTAKLTEKAETPPTDLSATESVLQLLALLQEILSCQDAAVFEPEDKKKDFAQILSAVIDPLLQGCALSATRLHPADMATFLINCVHQVQTTLALFQYTDERLEMLQAQVEAHLDTLVSEQVSHVLGQTGLGSLYQAVQQHRPQQGTLSSRAGTDALVMHAFQVKFDTFLSSPDSLLIPQCSFLQSANLRQSLQHRSWEFISTAYRSVYDAVADPANGYTDEETLPRTPDQVNKLLL